MNPNSETAPMAFSLVALWKLIKARKKFLILFVSIFTILTIGYSYIVPYKYSATVTILPPEEESAGGGLSSFLQSISGGVSLGGISKKAHSELYLEMATSRKAAKYITEKCGLDTVKDFKSENKNALYDQVISLLETEANRSGLMLITATFPTPFFPNSKDKSFAAEMSAKIANAAAEALDKINRERSQRKAAKKRAFISKILELNRKKLDSIDARIEKFQKKNKILALDEQTKAILENAVAIGTELVKAQTQLGIIRQQYAESSPIVQAYKRKVEELTSQYEKSQMGGIIKSDKFSISLEDAPRLIRKYANMLREQKILSQVILYLETQKYQETMQEKSDVPTIQTLDKAVPPYKRSSPSRALMALLGLFLSSFVGTGIILFQAYKKGEIEARLDVEN